MNADETNQSAGPSATDSPQCCLIDGDLPRQIKKALSITTTAGGETNVVTAAASSSLTALPSDVLECILLFCGAGDIEHSVKRCCKGLRAACQGEALWKLLCRLLGKRRDDDCRDTPSYRRCYLSNPCVPVDCASISEAIEHVEKLRRRDVAMNYEGK